MSLKSKGAREHRTKGATIGEKSFKSFITKVHKMFLWAGNNCFDEKTRFLIIPRLSGMFTRKFQILKNYLKPAGENVAEWSISWLLNNFILTYYYLPLKNKVPYSTIQNVSPSLPFFLQRKIFEILIKKRNGNGEDYSNGGCDDGEIMAEVLFVMWWWVFVIVVMVKCNDGGSDNEDNIGCDDGERY